MAASVELTKAVEGVLHEAGVGKQTMDAIANFLADHGTGVSIGAAAAPVVGALGGAAFAPEGKRLKGAAIGAGVGGTAGIAALIAQVMASKDRDKLLSGIISELRNKEEVANANQRYEGDIGADPADLVVQEAEANYRPIQESRTSVNDFKNNVAYEDRDAAKQRKR